MIQYDSRDWVGLVFQTAGSVWPSIQTKFWAVALYVVVCYVISDYFQVNLGTEGRTILFATMSVLLIFRANQAFGRYWLGRTVVGEFFFCCREFMLLSVDSIRGGIRNSVFAFGSAGAGAAHYPTDRFDELCKEIRVDVVRMTIAIAVALRLHTLIAKDGYCFGSVDRETKWLIDWERFRLRQLLTEQEFRLVDAAVGLKDECGQRGGPHDVDPLRHLAEQFRCSHGPQGAPPDHWPEEFDVAMNSHPTPWATLCQLARELVVRHMNGPDNAQPWGIKERFVGDLIAALAKMQKDFDTVNQIITTPLPLPYANICKSSLSVFLASLPFFVDYRLGWFANTAIPLLTIMALMGIDAIANELENPFGSDANDLDLLEKTHQLEREGMELLHIAGPIDTASRFVWRPMPHFVTTACCRNLHHYLAVRELSPDCTAQTTDQELSIEAYGARLRSKA